MAEGFLLALVARYPHPVALARRVGGAALVPGLRRLERAGLVARRRGLYLVTERGRRELEFQRALCRTVVRALHA
jgi:DNA-binding PadR family transcriptional regulator